MYCLKKFNSKWRNKMTGPVILDLVDVIIYGNFEEKKEFL